MCRGVSMSRFFTLDKIDNGNGTEVATLVCHDDGKDPEPWGNVDDFDRLFNACSKRWPALGWDIDKLIACVNECEFE